MFYVGFSSPKKKKIGSELIKWWTKSPYSHVYIRFESSKIPSTIYHAAHNYVHFISYDRFLTQNTVYSEHRIEVTEALKSEILTHCVNLSGEKYGYSELAKLFFMDLAHRMGCKLAFHDGKGYICSELVGEVLKKFFNVTFDKPKYALSPSDIEKVIIILCGKE